MSASQGIEERVEQRTPRRLLDRDSLRLLREKELLMGTGEVVYVVDDTRMLLSNGVLGLAYRIGSDTIRRTSVWIDDISLISPYPGSVTKIISVADERNNWDYKKGDGRGMYEYYDKLLPNRSTA